MLGPVRPGSAFALFLQHAAGPVGKEMDMELLAAMPDWLVWCAAGAAGLLALAALAGMLDAALELAN